jgi:hypothetical protein
MDGSIPVFPDMDRIAENDAIGLICHGVEKFGYTAQLEPHSHVHLAPNRKINNLRHHLADV